MAYGNFKNSSRKMALHKVLHDKAFNITKKLKHNGYRTYHDMIW